jgi:hypothetical protein
MARVAFPITTFQDAEGNPLSFGYVLLSISTDVNTPDPAQLCEGMTSKITLDTNGVVVGSPTVWPNASLSPSNAVYLYSTYRQNGQEVAYNIPLTV